MKEAPSARQRFDSFVADNAGSRACEAGKALVERYFDMWNTGDGAVADAILGATYVNHAHPEVIGPAALRSLVPRFRLANPDTRMTIVIVAANADFVAVRNTISRTVHGEPIATEGLALFRIEGGKLVEQWSSYAELEGAPDASPVLAFSSFEKWLSFRA
jgi:predicted SnoaL-like aldol condensation-catalyzing enzyme